MKVVLSFALTVAVWIAMSTVAQAMEDFGSTDAASTLHDPTADGGAGRSEVDTLSGESSSDTEGGFSVFDEASVDVGESGEAADPSEPAAAAESPEVLPVGLVPRSAERASPMGSGELCAEEESIAVFVDGVYELHTRCGARVTCGAERIDDLYSGRLEVGAAYGSYAEYLTQVVTGAISTPTAVFDIDVDATSTSILGAGLGPEPDPLAMAVFYWCRDVDTGEFYTGPGADFGVRFGWDTTVADEYPMGAARGRLFDRVRARLDLYDPEVQTAPPHDRGATIVKFPMWLWVDDPLEAVFEFEESPLEFVRIEMRARLAYVEWKFGDDDTITCGLDQMRPYIEGDDPFDDMPECHRIFTTLEPFEFSATLHYDIERRELQRRLRTAPWPDWAWVPHAVSSVGLETTIGEIAVHELLAFNVRQEIATE